MTPLPLPRRYLAYGELGLAGLLALLALSMLVRGCAAQSRAAQARAIFVRLALGKAGEARDLAREFAAGREAARGWFEPPIFLLGGQALEENDLAEAEKQFARLAQGTRLQEARIGARNTLGAIKVRRGLAAGDPAARAEAFAQGRREFEQALQEERGRRTLKIADTRVNLAILDLIEHRGEEARALLAEAEGMANISAAHLVPLYLGRAVTATSAEEAAAWFARVEYLVPDPAAPARQIIARHRRNLSLLGLTAMREWRDADELRRENETLLAYDEVRAWRENRAQATPEQAAIAKIILNAVAIRQAVAGAQFAARAAAGGEAAPGLRRQAAQAWRTALDFLRQAEEADPGRAPAFFLDRLLVYHALVDLLRGGDLPAGAAADLQPLAAEARERLIDYTERARRERLVPEERLLVLRRLCARLHLDEGRRGQARDGYEQLEAESLGGYLVPWNLGVLHYQDGRYPEARAAWGRALALLEAQRQREEEADAAAWLAAARGEGVAPPGETEELPWLIALPGEVADWPGLARRLAQGGQGQAPSPAGRVWRLLSEDGREQLQALAAASPPEAIDRARWALNTVLKSRQFYDEEAWRGVAPPPLAAALLARGADRLEERDSALLNRLLFEAAFPELVAPVWRRRWTQRRAQPAADLAAAQELLAAFARPPVIGPFQPGGDEFQPPELLVWTTVANRGAPLPLAAEQVRLELDGQPVPFVFGSSRLLARVRVAASGRHRLAVQVADSWGNRSAGAGGFKVDLAPPLLAWRQPSPQPEIPTFTDFDVCLELTDNRDEEFGPGTSSGLDQATLAVEFGRPGSLRPIVAAGQFATNPALHLENPRLEELPDGGLRVAWRQRQTAVREGGQFVLTASAADRRGNRAQAELSFSVAQRRRPGAPAAATARPTP